MPVLVNISGERFGLLTAVRKLESKGRQTVWLCLCDCGKHKNVETRNLRGGFVKSCGCASNQMRSQNSTTATHRLSGDPIYKTWSMMKSRCSNPKYTHYEYYGGRGIKVCERWQSFENFYADMHPRPIGATLDRKDTNGDYTPDNCRWATREEQVNNRRNNVQLTFHGETMSLVDWANTFGVRRQKMYLRMYRTGVWDIAEVFEWLGMTDYVKTRLEQMRLLPPLQLRMASVA